MLSQAVPCRKSSVLPHSPHKATGAAELHLQHLAWALQCCRNALHKSTARGLKSVMEAPTKSLVCFASNPFMSVSILSSNSFWCVEFITEHWAGKGIQHFCVCSGSADVL